MKRLFMLRNGRGGAVVKGTDGQPVYFDNKMVAKRNRQDNQVVSYGIDHKRFKGEK